MKRFDWRKRGMLPTSTGGYILFIDHEADKESALKNLKSDCDEMLSVAYMSGIADGKSGKEAEIKKLKQDQWTALEWQAIAKDWQARLKDADRLNVKLRADCKAMAKAVLLSHDDTSYLSGKRTRCRCLPCTIAAKYREVEDVAV